MTSSVTPEQLELERLRGELESLEAELALAELELTTRAAELHHFEIRYLAVVGSRLATLDALWTTYVEACAARDPDDRAIADDAKVSRHRAAESARGVHDVAPEAATAEPFHPAEELKQRYRQLARQLHPDLAVDADEQRRRSGLMARLNRAYADGDAAELDRIEKEWMSSPENVGGDDTAAELVRAIRKVAQVQPRLAAIAADRAVLDASPLAELYGRVEAAQREGRDLLAEMAAELDRQIAEMRQRVADVQSA